MKLDGVIAESGVGGEEEAEEECRKSTSAAEVLVGYGLTLKKKKSFLQLSLVNLARYSFDNFLVTTDMQSKGIQFVPIDLKRPLSEQGPFDIVLHKLTGKEWSQVIEDYQREHPEVIVLDPPSAIQHVHNRQSMLEHVADLKLPDTYGKVCIPRQLVISKDPNSLPDEVTKAELGVPLVVKPLVVDGTAKSHELFLTYDHCSILDLEPPLVLQEFVNHGGVLFKVYVVGESIKVVRRFSLPDVSNCDLSKRSGCFPFPRVSCASASAEDVDLDPSIAEPPPRPLLEELAKELRHRLGLQLFNIDMIRQKEAKDVYYVIDINYFPGFGKMPEYEHIFTDFLLNLMQSKHKQSPAAA